MKTSVNRLLVLLAVTMWALGRAPSVGATPKPAAIPPTQEIVVLDPNADPLGRPAVIPRPTGVPGLQTIDVPQTVLVHRYYYTGDRSFQAQLLPGGPCIVVANHPKTGERLNIPVQMPPGAPRVIYRPHSIEYDFGKHGVTIQFCTLTCQPKVEYRNCMSMHRHLENTAATLGTCYQDFSDRTGLSAARQAVATASKNAVKDGADLIGTVGRGLVAPVVNVGKLLPGAQMLIRTEEDRATTLRDNQIRNAEKAAANQGLTIPTGR